MGIISRGFGGKPRSSEALPPGQYLTKDFPVLSAGPTPHIAHAEWTFALTTEKGEVERYDWAAFDALPKQDITVDLHCVTRWSKLRTAWQGVSLDTLLAGVETEAAFAIVHAYGGYTTNLPLADLRNARAWIAVGYDGKPLAPEHGGPARLLVPHLYLWKSAKWVSSITLSLTDSPGFWEKRGYHGYGDPWREQRYDE